MAYLCEDNLVSFILLLLDLSKRNQIKPVNKADAEVGCP